MTSLPELNVINIARERPSTANIVIAEITSEPSNWGQRDGFLILKNQTEIQTQIEQILKSIALFNREHGDKRVSLIQFPELSVPESLIPDLVDWSKEHDSIIIAGSHYCDSGNGIVNRCPVIISGDVHYVLKLVLSPLEDTPVESNAALVGNTLTVFRNTQAGDFIVQICSDFLHPHLRHHVLSQDFDLLFVCSLQKNSSRFHEPMHVAVQESVKGLFIAYSNMRCREMADGKSSLFGATYSFHHQKLVDCGYTSGSPETKQLEISLLHNYARCRLDLGSKRPTLPPNVGVPPNIYALLDHTEIHEKVLLREPITRESLTRFIKLSAVSKRIDSQGAARTNRRIVDSDVYIERYLLRFGFAGIDSIGKLMLYLDRHEKQLVEFMSEWFNTEIGRGLSTVPGGFGISLLCTMIMIDKNSSEELLRYWRAVYINTAGPERIAEQMQQALDAARCRLGANSIIGANIG